MDQETHDNNIDVKINTKIQIFGNVIMLGASSVLLVGFLFLAVFMHTYWTQVMIMASVFVYVLLAAFLLTVVALLILVWQKCVVAPSLQAKERAAALRGQELKNRVVWAQPNCLVVELEKGTLTPLFPDSLIESPKTESPEREINEPLILEMYDQPGATYQNIATSLGTSYHQVQKVVSAHVRAGHVWKN